MTPASNPMSASDFPNAGQESSPPNPFASPLANDDGPATEHGDGMLPPTTVEQRLNPWLSIWTKPKQTIRQIISEDPKQQIGLLASLGGIASAMGNNQTVVTGMISLPAFLGLVLVIGPLAGFLMLYLYGAIIGWACRYLQGVAQGPEMRAAIAWAWVPTICFLPVSFALTASTVAMIEQQSANAAAFVAVGGFLAALFGIWSFVISLNTIAEVNQFSRWRAWGAMILPGLIVFAVVVVVAIVVGAVGAAVG